MREFLAGPLMMLLDFVRELPKLVSERGSHFRLDARDGDAYGALAVKPGGRGCNSGVGGIKQQPVKLGANHVRPALGGIG